MSLIKELEIVFVEYPSIDGLTILVLHVDVEFALAFLVARFIFALDHHVKGPVLLVYVTV